MNHSVSYNYNCWDQPLTFMDARSFVTHYEYNTKYQLEKIKQTVGGTLQETSFTYDDNGNLETVTDAEGHTVTYGYDALNRKTSITDALNHTSSVQSKGTVQIDLECNKCYSKEG